MKHFICLSLLVASVCACAPAPAPQRVHSDGNWQVMVANAGKRDMLCYAGATPFKIKGTIGQHRAKPYLMATRRPSGKVEISASPGYAFMRGSKAELAVDDDSYSLFYKDAVAWAGSDEDDLDIVEAMKTADDIEVRGVSQGGLTSVDIYPSHGFAAALLRLQELCP